MALETLRNITQWGIDTTELSRIDDIRQELEDLDEPEKTEAIRILDEAIDSADADVRDNLQLLKASLEGNAIDISDHFTDEASVRKALELLELDGVEIIGGHLVWIDSISISDKMKKLETFMDLANYIDDQNANVDGKIQRLLTLMNPETEFIEERRFLAYEYMMSLYGDALERWVQFIFDNNTQSYTLEAPQGVDTSEFDSLLSIDTQYIDFAKLNYIISRNNALEESIVDRESYTLFLMENNANIRSIMQSLWIEDIDGSSWLLAQRESVIIQLQSIIDTWNLDQKSREYLEVQWLYEYLAYERYESHFEDKDLFRNISAYNTVFAEKESFIEAVDMQWIDLDNFDPNADKPAWYRAMKEFGFKGLIMGVLLAIFWRGQLRTWWFAAIAGILGADAILEFTDTATGNDVKRDAFEKFDAKKVIPPINYGSLDHLKYSPTLTQLTNAMEVKRTAWVQSLSNIKTAAIFQQVLANNNLLQTNITNVWPAELTTMYASIGNTSIDNQTFWQPIPWSEHGEITQNDFDIFLGVLESIQDDSDITLNDALQVNNEVDLQLSYPNNPADAQEFTRFAWDLEAKLTEIDTKISEATEKDALKNTILTNFHNWFTQSYIPSMNISSAKNFYLLPEAFYTPMDNGSIAEWYDRINEAFYNAIYEERFHTSILSAVKDSDIDLIQAANDPRINKQIQSIRSLLNGNWQAQVQSSTIQDIFNNDASTLHDLLEAVHSMTDSAHQSGLSPQIQSMLRGIDAGLVGASLTLIP